jgi:uncharacterized RDD family membrane protein YckC
MGEVKRSGFFIRLLAALIDVALGVLVTGGVFYILDATLGRARVNQERVVEFVNGLLVLAYSSSEIIFAGTPGKLLLGLRIRSADGGNADRWRLFARWSTKWSGVFCILLFSITGLQGLSLLAGAMNFMVVMGCLFAVNDDKQAWHDQWCRTAVYRKPKIRREQMGFPVTVVDPSRSTAQDDIGVES